jgi:hypothetical protein
MHAIETDFPAANDNHRSLVSGSLHAARLQTLEPNRVPLFNCTVYRYHLQPCL